MTRCPIPSGFSALTWRGATACLASVLLTPQAPSNEHSHELRQSCLTIAQSFHGCLCMVDGLGKVGESRLDLEVINNVEGLEVFQATSRFGNQALVYADAADYQASGLPQELPPRGVDE